jgi:class 3 adenylate cyclase/tetratricopeptide (TPR) repeat protein
VLFADLKGSMELLADRDPEEARKILDPVLELMMEAVHRYEGTVNQVMGDGIMALFGAPVAHEDHAVRASYSALRMRDAVRRYSEELRRAQGVEVQIRVGVNSGDVVVRSIGSDLRMDYTAVGQTTHLAARMEQLAAPGGIRLTAQTLHLAEGFVQVTPLGPVPVKGLAEPVEVFELTGAGQARTRLQAAALRGLTRFVGRDAEVEHLRRILGQAGAGRGQVVAIVGEAGVGKSRLTYEFTHSHRVQNWLILEASSVSYGKATSYLPVIDLLKGYFKIGDRDDHREMRAKVLGRVLGLDRTLEPLVSPLLALLDVPVEDAAWQTLDPPQRRQRTLDAVKRLLLRESQVQPLLVVFEDLHWVDSETQALLDGLVDSLGSARLLLLVNYRPAYQHGWSSKTAYSQLRLDALPADSAGELLEALIGEDPGLRPLKQLLIKRGNPFFLEESVRTLVETKALAGERGRYRLTQPIQAIQVPPTVQAMLAARIDRLAPEDKRLLQVAAVIGKDVPLVLLQAIADLPGEVLRRGLDHLQAAEFLYETGLYPDLEYSFKHALTHEVTYGGLLQERRRELHARLVSAIETLHRDRLGEQIERVAHHALQGEVWDKALAYYREAGAKAVGRSAYREALSMLERAQRALNHLPERRETQEAEIDLRLEFQPVFNALGDLARMLDLLSEAERLAETLNDQRRLARVLAYTSRCSWWLGLPSRGVPAGERALGMARNLGDAGLEAGANYHLGLNYVSAGDFRNAIEIYRRSEALLAGALEKERLGMPALPLVIARVWLGYSLASLGDFVEGVSTAEKAVNLAEVANHPYSVAVAVQGVGLTHVVLGNFTTAIRWLERSLELARNGGFAVLSAISLSFLGRARTLVGHSDARVVLEEAVEYSSSIRFMAFQAADLAWLADTYLRDGQRAEAMTTIERALHLAATNGQRAFESEALLVLGTMNTFTDPPDLEPASTCFRRALSLAEELGMRPLVAHCHLGLGKLYRRTDKPEQAEEHLATATTMYREMGMTYWLVKAEAEMTELGR